MLTCVLRDLGVGPNRTNQNEEKKKFSDCRQKNKYGECPGLNTFSYFKDHIDK